MSYANGIITAPVTMADVQQALGSSSTDLGTLCSRYNINMWAKYKPVCKAVIDTTNEWSTTYNTWKSSATWYHGNTGTFGLTPKQSNSFETIRSSYDYGTNGWTYTRPSGGSSTPYRLTDFAGYNHNAPKMFASFSVSSRVEQGKTFNASCIITQPDGDNVTIADFEGTFYFGVAFCNDVGTVVFKGTAQTQNTGGVSFVIPTSVSTGTYYVYPFLSKYAIEPSVGGFSGSNIYYSCPNINRGICTVASGTAAIDVIVSARYTLTGAGVNVRVQNNESRSFSGCIAQLRFLRNTNWQTALESGEKQSSFSLSGNSVETIAFNNFDTSQDYHVIVVLESGTYVYDVNLIKPEPTPTPPIIT